MKQEKRNTIAILASLICYTHLGSDYILPRQRVIGTVLPNKVDSLPGRKLIYHNIKKNYDRNKVERR